MNPATPEFPQQLRPDRFVVSQSRVTQVKGKPLPLHSSIVFTLIERRKTMRCALTAILQGIPSGPIFRRSTAIFELQTIKARRYVDFRNAATLTRAKWTSSAALRFWLEAQSHCFTPSYLQCSRAEVNDNRSVSDSGLYEYSVLCGTKSVELSCSFSRVAECLPFAAGDQFDFEPQLTTSQTKWTIIARTQTTWRPLQRGLCALVLGKYLENS